MIKSVLVGLITILCMTACAQESTINPSLESIHWIPMQTQDRQFVYVDSSLQKQLTKKFYGAEPFTPTGYAIVSNEQNQQALINSKGDFIENYSDTDLGLQPLGHVTLLMKRREHEKKLPFWNWNWNILGGGVKKTATYVKIEIRVLETDQILLDKDVPYDENEYNSAAYPLDDKHFVLNGDLYQLKNQYLKKLRTKIDMLLENGRFIPPAENRFEIYDIKQKRPIFSNLVGVDKIDLSWKGQTLQLDSINQDRYAPTVPKLLKDNRSGAIYAFPQYDKALPKQIKEATTAQIAFLKEVSLVYSVNNSPYFILGRFNYDHEVWAYDWLYIDTDGHVLDQIKVNDFFILDQVGYLVWPDKPILFTKSTLEKGWKTGKIKYVYQSEALYLVNVKKGEQEPTIGLWNAFAKTWDLPPNFQHIAILDGKQQIFALQTQKDGPYTLYNNKTKQQIGTKSYHTISPNGLVRVRENENEENYFYIDIYTGKEYKQ
ncbi:hypothetical protein [Sphingobacterium sp. HMA12]|jgi:hypothetical protein|uniref:hypothetical protein n=1 Tax=Sphingobacterium sp. HMA12 TaxID=2050894 RepID=UPI0013155DD4|nr:hypothetical protein [Sphingobacterium sp. HMA12]